jgi:hypothetical protein
MSSSHSFQQTTSSTSNAPLLCTDVDFANISFSDPAQGKANPSFKSAYVSYAGMSKFAIQTPWLRTWDGICEPPEEYRQTGAPPKYNLNFSLKGRNAEEVQQFQMFLHAMDEKMIQYACGEHCMKWFKKKQMSAEVCEVIYSKQLKLAKDKETHEFTTAYPANFKAKVPCYDGNWKCSVYNEQQEEQVGDLSTILTGQCDVRAILNCSSVWFAGGKFGVTWNVQQLEYKADAEKKGYGFRSVAGDPPPRPPPSLSRQQTVVQSTPVAPDGLLQSEEDNDEEDVDSDME